MYTVEYFDRLGQRKGTVPLPVPLLEAVRIAEDRMAEHQAHTWRMSHSGDGEVVCIGDQRR
jgi:hypothetical protein